MDRLECFVCFHIVSMFGYARVCVCVNISGGSAKDHPPSRCPARSGLCHIDTSALKAGFQSPCVILITMMESVASHRTFLNVLTSVSGCKSSKSGSSGDTPVEIQIVDTPMGPLENSRIPEGWSLASVSTIINHCH